MPSETDSCSVFGKELDPEGGWTVLSLRARPALGTDHDAARPSEHRYLGDDRLLPKRRDYFRSKWR